MLLTRWPLCWARIRWRLCWGPPGSRDSLACVSTVRGCSATNSISNRYTTVPACTALCGHDSLSVPFQHILNMHTVGKELQCEICQKKVKNKWYLRRHHVTHHGAPLKKWMQPSTNNRVSVSTIFKKSYISEISQIFKQVTIGSNEYFNCSLILEKRMWHPSNLLRDGQHLDDHQSYPDYELYVMKTFISM